MSTTGNRSSSRQAVSRQFTFQTLFSENSWGFLYLVVFALNLWPVFRLLRLEYHEYFHSIEGVFLGLEQYIALNWPKLSWFPLWHAGMPFEDSYVPFYHLAVVIVSKLSGFTIARSYHVLTGLTYSLGPVCLAWMMRQFGASRFQSILGAAFWSLVSLSAFIMPGTAADLGGLYFSRRLQVAVMWAEAPHVAAMGLQCIAIGALYRAYQNHSLRNVVAAALAVGTTGITNVPGMVGLLLSLIAMSAAIGVKSWRRISAVCFSVGFLGYALVCWLVPPSSIATILNNSKTMHPGFNAGAFCLIVLLVVLYSLGHLLDQNRGLLLLRYALIEFILFSFVCLTAAVNSFELVPQGGRFHLEMDRSAAIVAGLALASFFHWLFKRSRAIGVVATCLALTVGGIQLQNVRRGAKQVIKAAKVQERSEFKTAKWLERNAPNSMTYAAGSTAFWLNAFVLVPQLTGCCDQGNPHRFDQDVAFQINHSKTSEQAKLAVDWAKLYGVRTLIANTSESTETYRDFENASKLDQFLPLLHEEGGDRIYKVQELNAPKAYMVRPGAWISQKVKTLEPTDEMRLLLGVFRMGGSALKVTQPTDSSFVMMGNLDANDHVWVQASFVPGWKLNVNGVDQSNAVTADGLGLIVFDPQCKGPCNMELSWPGAPDLFWARLVSGLTVAGIALVALFRKRFPLLRP